LVYRTFLQNNISIPNVRFLQFQPIRKHNSY
jgi:hypothetical protein